MPPVFCLTNCLFSMVKKWPSRCGPPVCFYMGVPRARNFHWWDEWTVLVLIKIVRITIRRPGFFYLTDEAKLVSCKSVLEQGCYTQNKSKIVRPLPQKMFSQTANFSKLCGKPRKFARNLWLPQPSLLLWHSIRYSSLLVFVFIAHGRRLCYNRE